MAQPLSVDVAHHVHLPAQILAAVMRALPIILLIRKPDEVVTSLVLRFPHLSVAKGLKRYVRFYRALLPHRRSLVVADFDHVVTDYGSVIRHVNERFGTRYAEFRHTPENVERCLALIEDWDRGRFGRGEEFERCVARPSQARETLKSQIRTGLLDERLAGVRQRAQSLYEHFTK
jgi:hypothetical protein